MAANSDFVVGDVVRLKSGGPTMTITSIGRPYETGNLKAFCTWFKSTNEVANQYFPFDAIEKAKSQ
jgi:uncharacterized protein YodC (DUF2158 family)